MTRDVWVYRIPINVMSASFTTVFHVPKGAKLLHVREQHENAVALWFEVDTTAEKEQRKFQIFGTGTGPIRDGLEYRGTASFAGGSLILHIYEVLQ